MPAPDFTPGTLSAAARDLSDDEFRELDDLLAQLPEPLVPLDCVLLDGFLCGMLVQPVAIEPAAWLPYVFDADARELPSDIDTALRDRIVALTLRRHAALNRALLEDGGFDPMLLAEDDTEDDTEDGAGDAIRVDTGAALAAPDLDADARVDDDDDLRDRVARVSRPLLPWVAGFEAANITFPHLEEIDDDAVALALARIYRHLPADTDEQRDVNAALDLDLPLASVDDAVEELVAAVADLADLTRDARYAVDTVRRDAPKVGRNDPCPCGSGKKYKRCHGAAGA